MTLELEWQKAEHEPPEVEFGFYNQVQQGDVDAVQENLRSGSYRQIAMRVRLSDDLVQNFRYHCIVCLSMVSRFCIEGGMPGEQAYRMSDFYIRKIDTATTIDQVEKLHDDACMDYVKRMQQRKIKQVCSKPVSLCLNYTKKFPQRNLLRKCTCTPVTYPVCFGSKWAVRCMIIF